MSTFFGNSQTRGALASCLRAFADEIESGDVQLLGIESSISETEEDAGTAVLTRVSHELIIRYLAEDDS